MTPYYQDEASCTCQCGCGKPVRPGRRFVNGHNARGQPKSSEHRKRISDGQRRAWDTKRQRKPVGSKNYDVHGYVRVKVSPGKGRWKKEHVLVLEQVLGRELRPGEHVHHINGIRDDNRIENLYLCRDARHHARVEATYRALLPELMRRGIIIFDRDSEEYRINA